MDLLIKWLIFISLQNLDNPLSSKNKTSPTAYSVNGHINQAANKTPNLINLDETKRTNQQSTDGSFTQSQFGKTLNVPNTNALHMLPIATPAAPKIPPRPAIMSTPKSSTTAAKNSSVNLLPTETQPLLLVTTANAQRQPQTSIVPNGRRLPLNGNLPAVAPIKQPSASMINNNYQMIDETTTKKQVNNRPRTAVLFTSTRMKTKLSLYLHIYFNHLFRKYWSINLTSTITR